MNLVHIGTQDKGAVTAEETDPDLPVSVQVHHSTVYNSQDMEAT